MNRSHARSGGGRSGGRPQRRSMDTEFISFARNDDGNIDPELFNGRARKAASIVADCDGKMNKSTQLRRFYDEIVMWEAKVAQEPDRFGEYLPFIKMLNAKVAYAEGRKLIDGAFTDLVSHCVNQTATKEDVKVFKLFFEAFMGFYKLERPERS